MVLLRFSDTELAPIKKFSNLPEESSNVLANFAESLHSCLSMWHKKLETFRAKGKKVAIFGAGHLAVKFINFYGLDKLVDCIIDDHPKKVGMLLPGSNIPVVSSEQIQLRGIQICISTLNPESEVKVRKKLTRFLDEGGQFISAFNQNSKNILDDLPLNKVNDEVFVVSDEIVSLDSRAFNFIKQRAIQTPRGRARICMHKKSADTLHEMFIGIRSDSYIRPHKHKNKTESFHLVEGNADIIILTDDGEISDIIELSFEKKIYYRLDTSKYHTLLINSPVLVLHEITNGPFDRLQSDYASFSPEEENTESNEYIRRLRLQVISWKKKLARDTLRTNSA